MLPFGYRYLRVSRFLPLPGYVRSTRRLWSRSPFSGTSFLTAAAAKDTALSRSLICGGAVT